MHPADELRGVKSNNLSGKRIVLGVTGSIAAVECIRLSRELIRHGAHVIPVMTPAATRIIHPDALEFATGHTPILRLTGETEHVSLCGNVKNPADLLLISPCTANTISKIAHGIDDTAVTTCATTALGSRVPIMLVPAMHLSMYDHTIIQHNIDRCKRAGIHVVDPTLRGNKAKLPVTEEIVSSVIRILGTQDLANKNILIIGGATAESIDDVRVLTNRSSGKTAIHLAQQAFYRGGTLELWLGHAYEQVPEYIKTVRFTSLTTLMSLLKKTTLKHFDSIILCAALADYLPVKQKGKIPSGMKKLIIDCTPAPKIISLLRTKAPEAKIVGFKVESSSRGLEKKANTLLNTNHLDAVIANTICGFGSTHNDIWIVSAKRKCTHKKGTKEQLANDILDCIT